MSCNVCGDENPTTQLCSLCQAPLACSLCRTQERYCSACWDKALLQKNPRPNFDPDAPIEIEVCHIASYAYRKRKQQQQATLFLASKKQQETVPLGLSDKTGLIELAHGDWPKLKPNFLAQKHPHELDATVYLDETNKRHDYYVIYENDGIMEKENNLSTTTMIHAFFAEKDRFKMLKTTLMGKNWGPGSTCKYSSFYTIDPLQMSKNLVRLLRLWEKQNVDGIQLGRFMHFLIECDLNNVLDLANSMYAKYSLVQQYLQWKHEHFLPQYEPYRTEFRFRSCKTYRKVGTGDLLAVRKNHGPPSETDGILWVVDFDWKCTKLKTFNFDGEKGSDLCSGMDDCNLSQYSLQQSDYARFAEQPMYTNWHYNGHVYSKLRFESMFLICFSEENPNNKAEVAPLQEESKIIHAMWERRADEVAVWEAEQRPPLPPKKPHVHLSDAELERGCIEVMNEVEKLMQRGGQSLFKLKTQPKN